jgi:hypothetical protein
MQSLIIGSVMVHNEYYHWTPNKVLAAAIGIGLAHLFTRLLWAVKSRWGQ